MTGAAILLASALLLHGCLTATDRLTEYVVVTLAGIGLVGLVVGATLLASHA